MPARIYVLIDFNCGRYFTHHASYLNEYATFLQNYGESFEIWINDSADSEIDKVIKFPVKKILRSNQYGHTKNSNFKKFIVDKFVNIIGNFLKSHSTSSHLFLIFQHYFSKIYTRHAFLILRTLSRKQEEIILVLPTLEPIGYRLIKQVNRHFSEKFKYVVRISGSEFRGIFSYSDFHNELSEFIKSYEVTNIKIGVEVDAVKKLLISKKIPEHLIEWCPIPSNKVKLNSGYDKAKPMAIGFLGSARKSKGFELVPKIVDTLVSSDIKFKAYVQMPSFKWANVDKTVAEILKRTKFIELIDSKISEDELNNLLGLMDILVLPYDREIYRFAGSGILFKAADRHLPIITFEGVGFEWDITTFEIGETINRIEDIPEILTKLSFGVNTNFIKYNSARNIAIKKILQLD